MAVKPRRGVYFYFSAAPSMSKDLEDILGAIDKDIKQNKNLSSVILDRRSNLYS
jgi:hypothetical protein